jgi:hypothetical protein
VSVEQEPDWDILGAADGVRLGAWAPGRLSSCCRGWRATAPAACTSCAASGATCSGTGPSGSSWSTTRRSSTRPSPPWRPRSPDLLRGVVDEPATVWGQSFGCLLAASVARAITTERLVLVSPFTGLPTSRGVAAGLLPYIPRPLYTATATSVCRWVFGPARGQEGAAFLATLRAAHTSDVARRAGWLQGHDHRSHFEGLLDGHAAVWFGIRDRLIDLPAQLEVFTELRRVSGRRSWCRTRVMSRFPLGAWTSSGPG